VGQPVDHSIVALAYARQVADGTIPACTYVLAACQRHFHDLKYGAERGLRFDAAAANRVCRFVELLPHIKGKWARRHETLKLEPWQCFILCNVFGWMRQAEELGKTVWLRRFKLVYLEMARKNAKSTLASSVGLYMVGPDGEEGAEVYSAATTRDQASIVFGVARQMAIRTPRYRERFGITVSRHAVMQEATDSTFKALSSDYNSLDGLNPHLVAVDELHAHKDRALYDVIETAMGAREQPLLWVTTTAGGNQAGVCYEVRSYVAAILTQEGTDDDSVFGIIYTAENGEAWDDPAQWRLANPNLGVSVFEKDLEDLARKARHSGAAMNNFKTKRLNIWVNALLAYFKMDQWDRGATGLKLEDMAGRECYIGLDLASSVDVASVALLFPNHELPDGRRGLAVFGRHYLPEELVKERASRTTGHYVNWAKDGHLILTPGNEIDLDTIERDLKADAQRFKVLALARDPWQAQQLSQHMMAEGVECIEVPQNVKSFSPAMKHLEGLLQGGRVEHDGNPASTWMLSNVVAKVDARDNVYPRKENASSKIDFGVALLNALNRVVVETPQQSSIYNSDERPEGLFVI
jgi:phage terminase large subunit-like protein